MKVHLSSATLIYFTLALILCHDLTLVAVFSAVAIHELTHLIVLWIMGGHITSIVITPLGLSIERSGLLSHRGEFLLSLSAPIVNLLIATLFLYFGLNACTVESNLSFGLINLLPIYPLDGGKALNSLLLVITNPVTATKTTELISHIFLILFWMFGIAVALIFNGGLSILMLSIGLFISIAPIGISNK